MISEPEMAGELEGVATREVMGGFDRELVRDARPQRPWLWAAGGVVTASALWAAALFLYGGGDPKPDMHGYRLDQDPCPSLRLKSIGAAIAPREPTAKVESRLLHHAVLDRISCFIPLRPRVAAERAGDGWSIDYTVGITVALHKKTDPGAEFEALRRVTDLGVDPEAKLETVPDLGDVAYLLSRDDGNSELRVLEGGAVFSLNLSAFTQYQSDEHTVDEAGDGPDTPDVSPYRSAMISDMRDLMAGLKH
ncbi:hypothetical protein [Streptomyces sp. B1I3]|uniref:hypothetical protein n=1 Tax=Streptomyces sp. B1I3 TaxID=3042264 RepID=UPI0027819D33|nr:hypothetical protein [Streptomyces sp. B1I3]MDQ0791747.1 hypothetical protein [Streptomyces sp. B1I3]